MTAGSEARPLPVRRARAEDLDAVQALLDTAFHRPDEGRLMRSLFDSRDHAQTLVAGHETLAGVAVLSHLRAPHNCLALGPIAVAHEHRNQHVGQSLIAEAIDWARGAEATGIFVLGRPRFYTRFGFSVAAAAPFDSDYPAEFLLALALSPLPEGGPLRYAPAFAALG